MSKRAIAWILIIAISVLIGVTATGILTPTQTVNVDGHSLVLPNNYTYVNGNNTDAVTVENGYNQQFVVTTNSIQEYYASSDNFTNTTEKDYNVTSIWSYSADMEAACIINDNGTVLIVDCLNKGSGPASMVYEFAYDLQVANGLSPAFLSGTSGNVTVSSTGASTSTNSGVSTSSSSSSDSVDDGSDTGHPVDPEDVYPSGTDSGSSSDSGDSGGVSSGSSSGE